MIERLFDLHRRLPSAATEHQRRLLEMQVEATDREIDDLYGLTPDERAVVRGRRAAPRAVGDPPVPRSSRGWHRK